MKCDRRSRIVRIRQNISARETAQVLTRIMQRFDGYGALGAALV